MITEIDFDLLKRKMKDCLDNKRTKVDQNQALRFRIADQILSNEMLDFDIRAGAYKTILEILDECEAQE